ncbi:MAG: hypothetical protein EXR83_03675 [Gammaproteobacteria bacterium]|nr:hypothetical protein [Gammaproteobacteria bacterium]
MTLEVYRYPQSLKAMPMEEAMAWQHEACRAVGAVMRNYDVLLTPGLGREVAKLGELDQNATGVDTHA